MQAGWCKPSGWWVLAGERDFRDFSCLPSGEGESQTARRTLHQTQHKISSSQHREGIQMSTDSNKNAEIEKVVKEVINVLEDGQKGFADIGDHLKDETLKRYFLAESLKRANFRGELENELHRHGVHDVHEEGTTAGTLLRAWGGLKAKLGAGDHSLLESAEQGEDEAKKVYQDALSQELPLPLRQLLSEQNAHILNAHDYVKSHRDALATK
jgi:uncharacterized protein (TIGR02284 family)